MELNEDAIRYKTGYNRANIIENASAPAGTNINLQAEGSSFLK